MAKRAVLEGSGAAEAVSVFSRKPAAQVRSHPELLGSRELRSVVTRLNKDKRLRSFASCRSSRQPGQGHCAQKYFALVCLRIPAPDTGLNRLKHAFAQVEMSNSFCPPGRLRWIS